MRLIQDMCELVYRNLLPPHLFTLLIREDPLLMPLGLVTEHIQAPTGHVLEGEHIACCHLCTQELPISIFPHLSILRIPLHFLYRSNTLLPTSPNR